MKKTFALLLALFLFIATFTGCGENSPETKDPNNEGVQPPVQDTENPATDFEYEENEDGSIRITGYVGTSENIIIPEKIEGSTVKYIYMNAFQNGTMKTVTLPSTIESIGQTAFANCKNLTKIEFDSSSSLKAIAQSAFRSCTALQRIDLSMDSLEAIYAEAFSECESLTEVKFGDNITLIGEKAFYKCISLQKAELPENLVELGDYAFANCTWLRNITIPQTLTNWGSFTFMNTYSLTSITFENGLKAIGEKAFTNCMSINEITLPASVKAIKDYAFANCVNLCEVVFLGDAPNELGDKVFGEPASNDAFIYYDSNTCGWDTTLLIEQYPHVFPLENKTN